VIPTYYSNPIINGLYFDSSAMDLADVIQTPESISHAVILLGITKPDAVAADTELSERLNVTSIKQVIDYLMKWNIKPVYTSTESVFDGEKGNYIETDPANPVLTYGWQKVQVENFLLERCPESVIARLALVVGSDPDEGTQLTRWVEAIERQETIYCAYDSVNSPVYVGDVAEAITRLIEQDLSGLFHISSQSPISRLGLFQTLLAELEQRGPVTADMISCSIHDFDLKEKRPLDVSMNPGKLIEATGLEINSAESMCREVVESMGNSK
jgi:dTDP-4-dehydrorhamnose reductase